ncbi:MAG: hypothetical protein RLZZ292_3596, partial [Bacteroidota bacterium]
MKKKIYLFIVTWMCYGTAFSQTSCPPSNNGCHYAVNSFGGGQLCPSEPYKLVFFDEFNGTSLDRTKWYSYYPYATGGSDTCVYCRRHEPSNSQQIFQDNNVVVNNGTLKLIAKRERATWMGATTDFTSGLINSKLDFNTYSKYEIRCKIPSGMGFWPAFWVFGGGTEIDVFEIGGDEPREVSMTVHRWAADGRDLLNPIPYYTGDDYSQAFHVFAVEYDRFYIRFLIDGFPVRVKSRYLNMIGQPISVCDIGPNTYLRDTTYPVPTNRVQVIANVAVATDKSSFTKAPNASTVFPSQMEIDWIRVYQRTPQAGLVDICDTRKIEGNSTICTGQSYTYQFTGAEIDSILWKVDSTKLRIVNRTNSTITIQALGASIYGETFITGTSSQFTPCPQTIFTKSVWIGQPNAYIEVNKSEICPVYLTAQVRPNDLVGNWILTGSRITWQANGNEVLVDGSKTATSSYQYNYTVSNGCGSVSLLGNGTIGKCPK